MILSRMVMDIAIALMLIYCAVRTGKLIAKAISHMFDVMEKKVD